MNIIELFENLNIDKTATLSFTSDEIIRIEKIANLIWKLYDFYILTKYYFLFIFNSVFDSIFNL